VYQSSAGADGGSVLRAEGPLLPGAAAFAAVPLGAPQEIYRGPIGIRFAYFRQTADEGAESAQASWTDPAALPAAVQLAQVDPISGTLLSASRVPLLIDAEPGCASPQTALCSRAPSLFQGWTAR
jgi:general secretion pathway protein J